jgi:hypothetical protein
MPPVVGNGTMKKGSMRHDEDRVFDVSKPHKRTPDATSKPVIVGHHPIMNDPMVTMDRPTEPHHTDKPAVPIKVAVSIESDPATPAQEAYKPDEGTAEEFDKPSIERNAVSSPVSVETHKTSELPELAKHHPMAVIPPQHDPSEADSTASDLPPSSVNTLPASAVPVVQTTETSALNDLPLPDHHGGHVVKTSHGLKKAPIILLVLLILLGIYGFVDAETSVSLPFYIFRKTSQTQPPASAPVSNTPTSTPISTDPYADWKTYTLVNEKATFKYPSAWTLTPSAVSDGQDLVELSAIDGFYFNIDAVNVGHPSSECATSVVYSNPITFLEQSGYINYYAESGTGCQTTSQINGAELSKTAAGVFTDLFSTKNLNPAGNFSISLGNKTNPDITTSMVKTGIDYKDAALILESMAY